MTKNSLVVEIKEGEEVVEIFKITKEGEMFVRDTLMSTKELNKYD